MHPPARPVQAARTYQVLGLIGEGRFGRVYRARIQNGSFCKEVAIELVREPIGSPAVLHRLSERARLLGLVRDRAVVGAEPPLRLNGRWALVMELADGCTLERLLREHGPVPPGVALEIIAEVARALDKLRDRVGPEGSVSCGDLETANIRVSAHGEVKIVDFGVSVDCDVSRAADPALDVCSLGLLLEELVTGWHRNSGSLRLDPSTVQDPAVRAALHLARQMTTLDGRARPSARDVEHHSEILLSALAPTSSLRTWAERTVPQSERDLIRGPWTGEILSETGMFDLRAGPVRSKRLVHESSVWLIVVAASTTSMLAMGTLLGSLIVLCVLALFP